MKLLSFDETEEGCRFPDAWLSMGDTRHCGSTHATGWYVSIQIPLFKTATKYDPYRDRMITGRKIFRVWVVCDFIPQVRDFPFYRARCFAYLI